MDIIAFFIPSMVALVLGALVLFFVLPRMSPYVLGGLAITMLGLGVWQHYTMFPYEYRASMVSDMLQQYSGFIMLAGIIVSGVIFIMMMFGGAPPAVAEMLPEMPAMPNIPAIANFTGNSNNSKGFFNLSGNSKPNNSVRVANNANRKNNIASESFKVV